VFALRLSAAFALGYRLNRDECHPAAISVRHPALPLGTANAVVKTAPRAKAGCIAFRLGE